MTVPCHRAGAPRECLLRPQGSAGLCGRGRGGSSGAPPFFVRTWRADASEPLFADWLKRVETSLQARWRTAMCPAVLECEQAGR